MNVALPIFSIHGNHDDPSGLGGQSCLDLLHESRHLNYFGKVIKNRIKTKLYCKMYKYNIKYMMHINESREGVDFHSCRPILILINDIPLWKILP